MAQDLEHLKKWIGERETDLDYVTIPAMHRLAATMDRDDPMPKLGDVLPYGWHLILFPRVARQSKIGADGHPERGDFLPAVPLPRRMFAGRRITQFADLHIGDEVRRESTIKDVRFKSGHSGQMVFVTVKADISTPRGLAITEEHDIVYREEPDPNAPPAPLQPAPGVAVWKRTTTPDPVMLFRFSALGFNGHRIHYDHPYVTKTEGYPDLIVPAGLNTMLVFELMRDSTGGKRCKFSGWRNVRPLFVNRPLTACGEPSADGKSAKLWIVDDRNALALSMTAEFE